MINRIKLHICWIILIQPLFLTPSNGGKDLFVHMNEIKMEGFKTLKEGQEVNFEDGVSDKGPCAINVIPN